MMAHEPSYAGTCALKTKLSGFAAHAFILLLLLLPGEAAADAGQDRGLLRLDGQHVKWGQRAYGSPAEITYAYLMQPRLFPGARNCAAMTSIEVLLADTGIAFAAFDREIAAAFRLWAGAADLRFTRIQDVEAADIVIGAQAGDVGVAFTNISQTAAEAGSIGGIAAAALCFDPAERWEVAIDGDPRSYNLRYVAAHEIGHAIGLDHRGRDHGIMGFAYRETVRSAEEIRLAPSDVAAAVRLYGPARSLDGVLTTMPAQAAVPPPPASCSATDAMPPGIACALAAAGGR